MVLLEALLAASAILRGFENSDKDVLLVYDCVSFPVRLYGATTGTAGFW